MGIIYILIPAALIISALALVGFIWSVRNRQFDDMESPALRILFDDEDRQ